MRLCCTNGAIRYQRRAVAAELREFLIDADDVGTPASKLKATWPSLAQALEDAALPELWWSADEKQGLEADAPAAHFVVPGIDGWARTSTDCTVVDASVTTARVSAAIAWIAAQPEPNVVVVAHGALLKLICIRLGLTYTPAEKEYTAAEQELLELQQQQQQRRQQLPSEGAHNHNHNQDHDANPDDGWGFPNCGILVAYDVDLVP